jgi:hypothetical protein
MEPLAILVTNMLIWEVTKGLFNIQAFTKEINTQSRIHHDLRVCEKSFNSRIELSVKG